MIKLDDKVALSGLKAMMSLDELRAMAVENETKESKNYHDACEEYGEHSRLAIAQYERGRVWAKVIAFIDSKEESSSTPRESSYYIQRLEDEEQEEVER